MKRTTMAASAAALILGTTVAHASHVNFTFSDSLTYSIADLTPDDGQAAGVSFYEGAQPVGNEFVLPFWVRDAVIANTGEIGGRFFIAPHTQLTITNVVDVSVTSDSMHSGGFVLADTDFALLTHVPQYRYAHAEARAGVYTSPTRLTQDDFEDVDMVFTNDSGSPEYGYYRSRYAYMTWGATVVPEPPAPAMLAIGLLSLAAVTRWRALPHRTEHRGT